MSDAPAVQVTDDSVIYRASALGSCERRLLAARLGFDPKPPPAKLQAAYDEGHRLEPIILKRLEDDYHWVLEQHQAEMQLHLGTGPDGRELYIVGHVDCLGTPPGGKHWMPVDAKAFAQSTLQDFLAAGLLAFPHYAWQQSCYCEGFHTENFCLPLYNKDTDTMRVKVYDTHPYSYEDIQERVYHIEGLVKFADVINVPCSADWGCPYDYLHDRKPVDTLPDELAQLVRNYLTVKHKLDAYTKARSVLAELIQKGLPQDGTTFRGEDATVSLVNNSKRIDTQKVKELLVEAGLDPDDYYTPGEGQHIVVKEKA